MKIPFTLFIVLCIWSFTLRPIKVDTGSFVLGAELMCFVWVLASIFEEEI